MGQTYMQKIQTSLIDLQDTSHINKYQAKKFILDYVNSGQKIQEVNKFIEDPSIELFLKYFINENYPLLFKTNDQLSETVLSKSCKGNESVSYIFQNHEILLKNKFKLATETIKEVFFCSCQREKMKQIINSFILNILNINSYFFYKINTQTKQIFLKNSKIIFFTKIQKLDSLYQNVMEKSLHLSKNNNFMKENLSYNHAQLQNSNLSYFEFKLDPLFWGQSFQILEPQPIFENICQQMAQFLENIHQNQINPSKDNLDPIHLPLKQFTFFILNLLDLSLKLQLMKINCELSLSIEREVDILDCEMKDQNCENFRKFYQLLKKKIKLYKKQANKKEQIYLNFNRNGTLDFIFGQTFYHPIMVYIRNKIEGEEPTISRIFEKHKKIIKYLKKIKNGLIRERMIKIDSSLRMFFSTNEKGNLLDLSICMILSEEKNLEKSLRLKKSSQNSSNRSKGKQCFIEKICRENPNFVKSGWFKMYLDTELNFNNTKPKQLQYTFSDFQMKFSNKKGLMLEKFQNHLDISELRGFLDLQNESINVLKYTPKELQTFVIRIFSRLDFFRNLPHENDEFLFFLKELHEGYQKHSNSFHNFCHGVNVMHLAYLIVLSDKNKNLINSFEIFTTVFSALCHDVAHTGFTNLFQVASQSQLSQRYNQNSPLENYHASKSFEILRKPQNNFLSSLSRNKFSKFRKQFISNILATDIKKHFPLLKQFQSQKKQIKSTENLLLTNIIVHASDFSGCVKSFEICQIWSDLLSEEFSKQYQEQGRLGLPQTPFMKDLKNMLIKSKNETGFLRVIVQPLYESISSFYNNDKKIRKMVQNLAFNLQEWERVQIQEEEKQKGKKFRIDEI